MSAPNFTPIQLYRTATAAATPSAGNLADGELAINLTDEKLYFKNASGVVKLLASNSGSLGSVTSVDASGSTTGLTFTGGPITSSGTLTLGGTLVVGNGGTGANTAAGARTNLGVPANDGTGATGTWGISVTGTAANVTGTVAVANGGTGATSLTSGYLLKGNGTSAVSSSVVYDTGTNVGIGTSSPAAKLDVYNAGFAAIQVRSDSSSEAQLRFNTNIAARISNQSNTALLFDTNATERMRIDSSGNVGIGTTSPQARLHVRPITDVNMWVTNSGADLRAVAINDAVSAYINSRYDASQHMFETSGSERVRITGAGNVGIGTSTPNAKLDVVGNVVMGAALITGTGVSTGDVQLELGANRTGDGSCYIDWHSTAGTDFESRIIRNSGANGTMDILNTGTGGISLSNFGSAPITLATNSAERMRIDSSGNVGIGTSSPAYKLDIGGFAAAAQTARLAAATGYDSQLKLMEAADTFGFTIRNANASGLNILRHSADATGVTAMFIGRDTGNVGIGTSSPTSKFDVFAASGYVDLRVRSNTTQAYMAADTAAITVGTYSNVPMLLTTNNTERMRIDSSGNVGIGTSSPQGLFHVVAGTNDTLLFRGPVNLGTGGSIYAVNSANSAVTPMEFGASVYYFSGGNVGINETAPDYKLDVNGTFGFTPGSSVTPADNGDVVFELTNNTTLTIKAKGSDGVVRSGTITLA